MAGCTKGALACLLYALELSDQSGEIIRVRANPEDVSEIARALHYPDLPR